MAESAVARSAKAKAAAAWAELNDRQRAYLETLYLLDQQAEEYNNGAFAAGEQRRPAAEWRWIKYGYVNVGRGAPRGTMQRALDQSHRRDQGAGSTIAALTDRGLVEQRLDELTPAVLRSGWCRTDTYHVSLKLTSAGRAAARASGVDDDRPAKRPPRGMLSEWLWTVLVKLWRAGDEGVDEYRHLRAWGYLGEERKDGALVERTPGKLYGTNYVLTGAGREHYRQHWTTYARLYPQVSAPHPDGEVVWPASVDTHLRVLGNAAVVIGGQLAKALEEQQQLLAEQARPAPTPADPAWDTPELLEARSRDLGCVRLATEHRERRLALLEADVPALRRLYRTAAARYAATAAAVTHAAVGGTDPRMAVHREPLDWADTGRPAFLPQPVTGLAGPDADIAALHRVAMRGQKPPPRRRRRGEYVPTPPADEAAQDLTAYAGHLAELVRGGQLVRLRLRVADKEGQR